MFIGLLCTRHCVKFWKYNGKEAPFLTAFCVIKTTNGVCVFGGCWEEYRIL